MWGLTSYLVIMDPSDTVEVEHTADVLGSGDGRVDAPHKGTLDPATGSCPSPAQCSPGSGRVNLSANNHLSLKCSGNLQPKGVVTIQRVEGARRQDEEEVPGVLHLQGVVVAWWREVPGPCRAVLGSGWVTGVTGYHKQKTLGSQAES